MLSTCIIDAALVRVASPIVTILTLSALSRSAVALTPVNSGTIGLRGQWVLGDIGESPPPDPVPVAKEWTQARLAEQLSNRTGMGRSGGKHNFCDREKLVPTFYLLGAPKCATTSFSMELGRFGNVREAPHLWSPKEWHFWESFATDTDPEYAKEEFYTRLGDCPTTNRLVLGDYSITNLAAIPLPTGMELTPCSCNNETQTRGKHGGDVPRLLDYTYGDTKRRVTLMVMIREPLSRMQSAWHHAKSEQFATYWGFQDCCLESFETAIKTVLDAAVDGQWARKIAGTGNVWQSLYGRQIKAYLEYFNASQFIIVPYRQYTTRNGWDEFCADLETRLDAKMNCSAPAPFEENVHAHPSLEKEVSADVREAFDRLMVPEKKLLMEALETAYLGGANLVNYDRSRESIREWLEGSW